MKNEIVSTGLKALPVVIATFYKGHESGVLTAGSILFSSLSVGFAVKNSRFILDTIDDAKDILAKEKDPETRKKIYKSALKDLAPKVLQISIPFAGSVVCTLVNKKKTDKKIADLTAALSMAQNAIVQYRLWEQEAKKELGEEKTNDISKKVAEQVVNDQGLKNKKPVNEPPKVKAMPSSNQMYLYMDPENNRKFWSEKSPNEVKNFARELSYKVCDGVNYDSGDGEVATYNDIYNFMGPHLDVQSAKDWGWTAEMSHGQRSSELIGVEFFPDNLPDGETLCWTMELKGVPLWKIRR